MNGDEAFVNLLESILRDGKEVTTRNATTLRKTHLGCVIDASALITIRQTAWKNALREWEWFMSGSYDINDLHPSVHSWWQPWADGGKIRNNYSRQFRSFMGMDQAAGMPAFDQIDALIKGIKNHPFSRRNVITTWNTSDMHNPLTPITNCHGTIIQVFVQPDQKLDLTMYQRSADMALGVPHNWIQYQAFLMWLAFKAGLKVGKLNWVGGDCHIYEDHLDVVKRIVREGCKAPAPPQLVYTPTSEEFKADDFTLDRPYSPLIKEKLKMTV